MDIVFTEGEKNQLLHIARKSIEEALEAPINSWLDRNLNSLVLNSYLGAFVSIYVDNELRGCIGRFRIEKPLWSIVAELSVSAALNDRRFLPVTLDELTRMIIEISVVTPLRRVTSINEIIPGKHGIYLEKDQKSGTYLPQVAQQAGWNTLQLLSHCSAEKAHLGNDGWKEAKIYIYETIRFAEEDID